jgi:hypothetical protein
MPTRSANEPNASATTLVPLRPESRSESAKEQHAQDATMTSGESPVGIRQTGRIGLGAFMSYASSIFNGQVKPCSQLRRRYNEWAYQLRR